MNDDLFVGVQLFPFSYLHEGVEQTLKRLRDWSAVNSIMLVSANRGESKYSFAKTWDSGHENVVGPYKAMGGFYSNPDLDLYGGTALKPVKCPEEGLSDIDSLQVTVDAARPLGMKVYAMIFEALYANQPDALYKNTAMALAQDVLGRPAMQGCYNNPHYRNFLLAMTEDHVRNYDIEGIYIEFEGWGMQSPSYFLGLPEKGMPICFCDHCMDAAKKHGWDGEKARKGFLELIERPDASDGVQDDGAFVEALRIMLHYPEILAWESLWMKTRQRMFLEIYGTAKAIDPDKNVGWNVNSPVQTMPVARAAYDYGTAHQFSDWVKPNIHNGFAAGMFNQSVAKIHEGLLPGVAHETVSNVMLNIFGLNPPLPADNFAKERFSTNFRFGPQFVENETKRVVRKVQGRVPVYAGLDVEPPVSAFSSDIERGMEASVNAALDAGAQGLIMGQFYHDWPRESLEAVGRAVRSRSGALS